MADKEPSKTEKKQIELVVGQPVQITLQSMAGSTGYSWFLLKLTGGLGLSDVNSVPTATVPGQIAPINQVFSFMAMSKGTFEVEFGLIAPWRPGEPVDTEQYEVKITEPKKTAADDIEAAMKGREFISAAAVNVGPVDVIKYAAPVTQPVPKYAAPTVCGPVMVPPYAAPICQVQPFHLTPMSQVLPAYSPIRPAAYVPTDPCLDPRNSALAANVMIAYAAPVGPSTVAAFDPCYDPKNIALTASTMVAYAAPVIARDPCYDPRNALFAANTMIAYAAPVGPSTVAAMRMEPTLQAQQLQHLYPTAVAGNILYAAPMTRTQAGVSAVNILYAVPMTQGPIVYPTTMPAPYVTTYAYSR